MGTRELVVAGLALACCGCAAAEPAPLGLVLSGGGAKGAYEVGVWRELQAAGLAPRVAAVSGTSVGAINAALFATRPDAAGTLWLEHMEDVFALNTNRVGETIQKTVDDAARAVAVAEETGEEWRGWASFVLSTLVRAAGDYVETVASDAPREGYIDSSRLAAALEAALPRDWPQGAPRVYATAVEKGAGSVSKTWTLNDEPHDRRILMLRASTAIPFGFDTVRIDGKTYVDGGWESRGGDNVPLEPVLEKHPDIKTALVVYLDDEPHLVRSRVEKNRAMAAAAGVRLVEIVPSEDIGGAFGWEGVFDADPATARHLVELGRADARKALRAAGLAE